ncbi:MAG: YciI family protein [Gammaproteobacteria bacterium]|nr:YciI family protein [Gammaproteobacteria bacterium]
MLYAIFGEDVPDSLRLRPSVRPRHLAHVQPLLDAGRLILAGPHPAIDAEDPGPAGFSGSLIVAEFESLEAAERWAASDPYLLEGVFARVTVKPFRKVLP